jgi:hypothetical protein
MTDALGPNDTLRLGKYFVQILAGVTNTEIVIDPDALLLPGVEAKIPFDLNSTDYSADAIVLSAAPGAFDFELETPAGIRINHNALGGVLGVGFVTGTQINFYRLSLPIVVGGAGAHQGRWHVVLNIRQTGRWAASIVGLPYSVIVQARSSLTMAASLAQPSFEPGTTLNLRATLDEIGLPVERRAKVRAEVKRPDGTQVVVPLIESDPGVFEGSTPAPLSGIYPERFRAAGQTLRGFYFTREQLRSGMAWRIIDQRPPHGHVRDFLRFLLNDPGIRRWLESYPPTTPSGPAGPGPIR